MQDKKIEKIAAVAVNITKVLVIIYLGFVEVFKIGKLLREKKTFQNGILLSRIMKTKDQKLETLSLK